jgi:hypothetical protein
MLDAAVSGGCRSLTGAAVVMGSAPDHLRVLVRVVQISLCGLDPEARSRLCAKLRSGNHKTAFGAKPAENLTFPLKNTQSQRNSPGR